VFLRCPFGVVDRGAIDRIVEINQLRPNRSKTLDYVASDAEPRAGPGDFLARMEAEVAPVGWRAIPEDRSGDLAGSKSDSPIRGDRLDQECDNKRKAFSATSTRRQRS
jgi:hypothetical protein